MLKNTEERSQAGVYRVIDVWPNGQEDQPYTAPTEIPFKIRELIDWSKKSSKSVTSCSICGGLTSEICFYPSIC